MTRPGPLLPLVFRHVTENRMPRGRKPEGETSLTSAQRQARYRARQHQAPAPSRTRPRIDRRGRLQRWHDAWAELLTLQADYAAWLEALPETLHGTATAEALQAIVDLDLETLASVEPPRGYGRD
jgi:hypothetical protein